jgi:hypothetical protein
MQGIRLLEDVDELGFGFGPGMALPASHPTHSNLSSLEHLTSSTASASLTESGYTPTDFQSATSALSTTNRGFTGTYSSEMFEPFLSSIFSSSSTINAAPTQSSQPETHNSDPSAEESFPFPTNPVDVQPFMASIEDEWFYEALVNPSMFTTVTVPAPAPLQLSPVLVPAALPQRVSPFTVVHPYNPEYVGPPLAELNHYRKSNLFPRSLSE